MIKIGKVIATITGVWLLSIAIIWISNSNKVAIVVTDWGQPEGFSDSYYQGIALRSRIGIKANSPSEACTEYFVGNYPYRSSMGGNIHASSFLTDGYSEYYDGFGMYRFDQSLGAICEYFG